MATALTLVYAKHCPYAHRAWLAAEELGLDYIPKETSIKAGEKPAWFTDLYKSALGANEGSDGKVPVLIDGDFILAESSVVVNYLFNKYGSTASNKSADLLVAPSPFQQAHIEIYVDQVLNGKLVPANHGLIMAKSPDALLEKTQALLTAVAAVSAAYEKFGGPYFLGDKVTFADLVTWPIISRMGVAAHYRGFVVPDEPRFAAFHR